MWRPPSLSDLTTMMFNMGLTQFVFEASKSCKVILNMIHFTNVKCILQYFQTPLTPRVLPGLSFVVRIFAQKSKLDIIIEYYSYEQN